MKKAAMFARRCGTGGIRIVAGAVSVEGFNHHA
jgi:hypothetical protein